LIWIEVGWGRCLLIGRGRCDCYLSCHAVISLVGTVGCLEDY
jgi:hypothetical protein